MRSRSSALGLTQARWKPRMANAANTYSEDVPVGGTPGIGGQTLDRV
jgi:hypothetical protein